MSTENLFSAPMPSAEMVDKMFAPREAFRMRSIQTPEEMEELKEYRQRYREIIKMMEEKNHV